MVAGRYHRPLVLVWLRLLIAVSGPVTADVFAAGTLHVVFHAVGDTHGTIEAGLVVPCVVCVGCVLFPPRCHCHKTIFGDTTTSIPTSVIKHTMY